jgi:hypothetical protein
MKGIIGSVFILIPFIALSLIYLEGGLMGVGMYIAYIISTFLTLYLPYIGIKLLRGKSI